MKKIGLFAFIASALSLGVITINVNASSTLPEPVNNVITLTEDVNLESQYEISGTKTIDLNGYKIIKPVGSWYGIHNTGILTIVDNGETKGEINCSFGNTLNGTVSCIDNEGSLTVDGVTVKSTGVGIKNEANATLNIKDSNLENTLYVKSLVYGALLNAGTATVKNSVITGTAYGIHISGNTGYNTRLELTDTKVTGVNSAAIVEKNSLDETKSSINEIIIHNGEYNGGFSSSSKNTTVVASGDFKIDRRAVYYITHATSGSRITMTTSGNLSSFTVPEGVTLVIPEDITANLYSATATVYGTIEGEIKNMQVSIPEDKKYVASLSNALSFEVPANNETVKKIILLMNSSVMSSSGKYSFEKRKIEIDLAGFEAKMSPYIYTSSDLTISDSSENKTGSVNGYLYLQEGATVKLPKYLELKDEESSITYKTIEFEKYSIVLKDGDYSKYDDMLELADDVIENEYTSDSYLELVKVLDAAAIVIGDRTMKADEQDKIDEQTSAIKEALENLVKKADSIDPESKEVSLGVILDDEISEMLADSRDATLQAAIDSAIEDGLLVSTSIVTDVLDPKTASEDDKKDIDELNKKLPNGLEIANYFDLSILVMADNTNLGKISETVKPIVFKVAIPEELIKKDRTFYIYRNHDGVSEIPTTLEGNIITFEANLFSVYALAYKDKVTNTENTVEEEKKTTDEETKNDSKTETEIEQKSNETKSPKTGDEINIHIIMLIISAVALVIVNKKAFEN